MLSWIQGAAPACAFVDAEAHSMALQASVGWQVGTSGFSSFASLVLLSWLKEPLMIAASVSEPGEEIFSLQSEVSTDGTWSQALALES